MTVLSVVAATLLSQTCAPGQSVTADTAGQCCWPQQVWSNSRSVCVGVPSCPPGLRAERETCVADCAQGQEITADSAGHCCWPQQVWSSSRSVCVGVPSCPSGFTVDGEACVVASSPPPEPPPLVTVEPPRREPIRAAAEPPPQPPADPIVGPVREVTPAPEPRAPTVSRPKDAPPEREYGIGDIRAHFIVDFGYPAMLGAQGELAINITKGTGARFGVSLGFAVLGHPGDTSDTRHVVLLEAATFTGVRLGSSPLEWLVRVGSGAASVNQFGNNLWYAKLFVGTELLIAFSRKGSGMSFGFDCFFLSGFSFVPRIGFIL